MTEEKNGKVSTREFYNYLMDFERRQNERDDKFMDKVDEVKDIVIANTTKIEANVKSIDRLERKSNLIDTIIGIGAGLGAFFGITK